MHEDDARAFNAARSKLHVVSGYPADVLDVEFDPYEFARVSGETTFIDKVRVRNPTTLIGVARAPALALALALAPVYTLTLALALALALARTLVSR